jgi:dTDP-glucose 4,6-dehydratase
MMQERVLVLGSNCFTGSHLVAALLEQGFEVHGLSRSREYGSHYLPYSDSPQKENFHFHHLDLRESALVFTLLDKLQPKYIFTVAALSEVALSHQLPLDYFSINTLTTVRLAHWLKDKTWLARHLHISSAEVFGSCEGAQSADSHAFRPSTPYAVSKLAADLYLETLRQNFDYPVTLIRSTNVFGQRQQLFKIIPRTIIYGKLGKKIQLHGGGTAVKSFIHVKDVIAGLLLTLKQPEHRTWHFTQAGPETIADIVRMSLDSLGLSWQDHVEEVGERLGQDARYWLDDSDSREILNWSPQISLAEGIAETRDWVEMHWQRIQSEPHDYIYKH